MFVCTIIPLPPLPQQATWHVCVYYHPFTPIASASHLACLCVLSSLYPHCLSKPPGMFVCSIIHLPPLPQQAIWHVGMYYHPFTPIASASQLACLYVLSSLYPHCLSKPLGMFMCTIIPLPPFPQQATWHVCVYYHPFTPIASASHLACLYVLSSIFPPLPQQAIWHVCMYYHSFTPIASASHLACLYVLSSLYPHCLSKPPGMFVCTIIHFPPIASASHLACLYVLSSLYPHCLSKPPGMFVCNIIHLPPLPQQAIWHVCMYYHPFTPIASASHLACLCVLSSLYPIASASHLACLCVLS